MCEQNTEHHHKHAEIIDVTRDRSRAVIQRGRLYVHVKHRNKKARQENSEETDHSQQQGNEVEAKKGGWNTDLHVLESGIKNGRCDTYITIVNPPPFPPPGPTAIGALIMLGLLSATLSMLLRFHIAPPAPIRVGMPPEVKMPGIS